ncbi:MAG: bestrophin family protein [Archangium sp.]
MLVTHRVRLPRIISGTGRSGAIVVAVCVGAFLVNKYVIADHFQVPVLVPTTLGSALAFFIGFNNNQAYGRWWEGRIIWGGLVNESRTWARLVITFMGDTAASKQFVRRQISFIYALKDFLRGSKGSTWREYLNDADRDVIQSTRNRHNAILLMQGRELQAAYVEKKIDGYQLLELERALSNLTNEMGKAERIKGTVFPTTYSYYTYWFVFLLIMSSTAVMANAIGPWSILFGTLIGYVFNTIHTIGQMLLNPFEATPTGVALDQISRNIEINLLEMLGEKELPAPVTPVNGEYVL